MTLRSNCIPSKTGSHLFRIVIHNIIQLDLIAFHLKELEINNLQPKKNIIRLSKQRELEEKGFFKVISILVFIFFFQTSNVHSQSKIAVLIANQNYLYANTLRTPIAEIDTIEKICKANNYKTLVFKNVSFNNYNLIFDSIEKIIDQGAFLYIHYAGHGVQLDGENYIVPIDAHPNTMTQAERQCVKVNQFIKLISDYQNTHDIKSLLCFDACRDNPFKQIIGNINIGLKKIDYSPINTGIIYSCAAGKTALDGRNDYSPFAKVWISQIQNCNFSISEISTMIDGELLKLGLSEDRLPERRFVGLSSVYFCAKEKVIDIRNHEAKLMLLNSLKDNMDLDFSNRNFTSVIGKSKWVDSLLSNNKELKENIPVEDLLRIKYLESKSFFEINDLENSEKGFESLWTFINVNNSKIKDDFFYDTYFYLGRLFALQKKWNKIRKLRSQFLSYSKTNNNVLDIITTYDKIAGDFEGENQIDSARFYYNKVFEESNIFNIKTTYEASCITSFYNNKGKFNLWQNEFQHAIQSLQMAYNLFKKNNLSTYYVVYDLADFYINYKITFNKDSAIHYLSEYKIATKLNTVIERLNYLNLDLELNIQLKNQDSIKTKLELYYEEMNKLIDFKILKNEVKYKKFDSLCEVPYWNLSFLLPKNIYPILFIDKNLNEEYDNQDIILTPDLQNKKLNTALEIIDKNKDEAKLVVYQDHFQVPNSGIVNLQKNVPNENFILTHQSNLMNSTVEFQELGDSKKWTLTIYLSDIGINTNVKYYFGITNHLYDNKYIIKHSNHITMIPSKQGANYLYKSLY